ncbi:MAG: heavy metal-binding domain-containing protein, partial [Acidobacteriota bacterium]
MTSGPWECSCGVQNSAGKPKCRACGTSFEESERYKVEGQTERDKELKKEAARYDYIQTSTTGEIPGYKTSSCMGIVTAQVIMGIHVFKDISAALGDIFGGRVTAYENELRVGARLAIFDLKGQVEALGANAVIGL